LRVVVGKIGGTLGRFGEVGKRRMRRREIGGCIGVSLLVVKVERCEGSEG
jgi:hypothetical protein